MTSSWTRTTALLIWLDLTIAGAIAEASIFQIDQWTLSTGVIGTWPNIDSDGTQIVSNPLQVTHSAQVGSSTATTTFNFAWNDTFGDFLLQTAHRAADVDPSHMTAISDGFIYVTAHSDLLFAVDSSYSYYLPVNPMVAVMRVTAANNDPPYDQPFGQARHADTFLNAPVAGTFTINGQATLLAGRTYVIDYDLEVNAYGTSGQIAQGDGYLHFTLAEVPSPAALAPLAFAALFLRRPQRHSPR
jgi:hypothetical protein